MYTVYTTTTIYIVYTTTKVYTITSTTTHSKNNSALLSLTLERFN